MHRAELGKGIVMICAKAFRGCTSLSEVILPDGLDIIRESAFEGCTSLLELSLPESVKDIEINAFKDTPWYDHLSKPFIVGRQLLLT